jgi:Dockerin type I domain
MTNKIAVGIILTSFLILTCLSSYVQKANAQPTPVFLLDPPVQVYLDPLTISALPDEVINVSVYVSSPVELNLYGWQMELQWDPSILSYSSHAIFWNVSGTKVDSAGGRLFAGAALALDAQEILLNVPATVPSKVLTITCQSLYYGMISSVNITSCGLMGRSDTGNGWTGDPYNGVPKFTQYDRWPDLNQNGIVGDTFDLILLTNSYLTSSLPGSILYSSGYNSRCDFNNDSIVDHFDMAIFRSDLGKTPSDPTWPNPTYPNGLTNTIYVFNETIRNSRVQTSIPGDVNLDGLVDIFDAIKLAIAFGSKPPNLNYDPYADINADGMVDLFDAILLANHYAQHYP